MTAVYYINWMGGTHSKKLMEVTSQIWDWSLDRKIILAAKHLPGVQNVDADRESRSELDSSEWKLDPAIFHRIMRILGPCQVDLFASRISAQLPKYMSWKPDPGTIATDALSQPCMGGHQRLCISPVCIDRQVPVQGSGGASQRVDTYCSSVANPTVVGSSPVNVVSETNPSTKSTIPPVEQQQQKPSTDTSVESSHVANIRNSLGYQRVSKTKQQPLSYLPGEKPRKMRTHAVG